jgi:hypothetical protein
VERLLVTFWSIRLDFAAALVEDFARRQRVADILVRPCFRELERLSIHRGDRWIEHGPVTAERIVRILADTSNASACFDTRRGRELVATADIRNGTYETNAGPTRFNSDIVIPLDRETIDATVESVCDLADALDVGAGFVAAEPTFRNAQSAALAATLPLARPGLSERRRIERRGYHWHQWERARLLSGPEWGTFLGGQHLEKLDLDAVRASGAFERVISISPRLAFFQVTADPDDDGRDVFEERLVGARGALSPILMDLSDVHLT